MNRWCMHSWSDSSPTVPSNPKDQHSDAVRQRARMLPRARNITDARRSTEAGGSGLVILEQRVSNAREPDGQDDSMQSCAPSESAGRVRRRSAEVALVSARIRGTQGGGRESLQGGSRRGTVPAHAYIVGVECSPRRRQLQLSIRGRTVASAARLSGVQRPPVGWSVVVGAPRVRRGVRSSRPVVRASGCPPARPQPERLLREY